MSAEIGDRPIEVAPLSGETRRPYGQEDQPTGQRRRYRTFARVCLAVYILCLHGLTVAIIWDPASVQRVKKFLFQTQESQGEYRGIVIAHSDATKSMPDGTVVFLGDSRMRDLDVTAVADRPAMNLSIGGDTTEGLLYRIPRYHRLDRCRLVILGVGVNDLSHFSDDEIHHNYVGVLTSLKDLGVRRILVCSILPVAATYHQANSAWLRGHRTSNPRIAAVNEQLRALCTHHLGAEFVDTTADVVDQSGNLRPDFSLDGLHLNEAGSRAWADALRRQLPAKGLTDPARPPTD